MHTAGLGWIPGTLWGIPLPGAPPGLSLACKCKVGSAPWAQPMGPPNPTTQFPQPPNHRIPLQPGLLPTRPGDKPGPLGPETPPAPAHTGARPADSHFHAGHATDSHAGLSLRVAAVVLRREARREDGGPGAWTWWGRGSVGGRGSCFPWLAGSSSILIN